MPAPRLDLFSFGQYERGRILRGFRQLMAARVGAGYGLGWPVSCSAVACALRVGRSRNECQNSASGVRVKAGFQRKNVEIRSLAYGRETNVTSLFGCCARRATRLHKTERTRYAHPATCFVADPRGYASAFPRRAYCCRDGLCHARAVPRGGARTISNTELYRMYEWLILSSVDQSSGRY